MFPIYHDDVRRKLIALLNIHHTVRSWQQREEIARCRHVLKDPKAAKSFRHCAILFPASTDPIAWMRVGNYYRLAGDQAAAEHWFHEAYTALKELEQQTLTILGHRMECAYMLGMYADIPTLYQHIIDLIEPYDSRYHTIERLVYGQQHDPEMVEDVFATWRAQVSTEEEAEMIPPDSTQDVISIWDWYEIAYRLQSNANTTDFFS